LPICLLSCLLHGLAKWYFTSDENKARPGQNRIVGKAIRIVLVTTRLLYT